MRYKPFRQGVLLEVLEKPAELKGILLPEVWKKKRKEYEPYDVRMVGQILDIGPVAQKFLDYETFHDSFKIGDKVAYMKNMAQVTFEEEGTKRKLAVIDYSDMHGVYGEDGMLYALGDRLLIYPLEKEVTEVKGIILLNQEEEGNSRKGRVLSVGKGKADMYFDGEEWVMGIFTPLDDVFPDDIIIYNKNAGTEVKLGDKECLIIKQDDVLAIDEKNKEVG